MRAVVCHAFGSLDQLVIEDRPRPKPGPTQALVGIHAVGLNFHDVLAVEGRSQLKREFPFSPGVEAAGIVLEVGSGITKLRPGQRVLGSKTYGACSEEVVFAEDELAVLPDGMDMLSAATFYIAAGTVRYALQDRARLEGGEILLVLGAGGGGGLAAVEIGKALGARVVAAASSEEKLALAKAHGADVLVRYDRGPLDLAAQKAFTKELLSHAKRPEDEDPSIGKISSLQDGAGYHVILDGVGGTYAEPALRALGWEGRYLTYGFAAGMANVPLGPALFKNADIMGIQPSTDKYRLPGRNPNAMATMFGWYIEGKLRPEITNVFPLADAAKALRLMKERKATGRIVLTTSYYEAS